MSAYISGHKEEKSWELPPMRCDRLQLSIELQASLSLDTCQFGAQCNASQINSHRN